VIQYRRLAALILGAWLGGSVFADVAVIQNFDTVDRFLASPGNTASSIELGKIGRQRERVLLRRNAGEENAFIFENWERAEFALGAALLLLLTFGGRPDKWMLALNLLMFVALAAQHLYLSPAITDLGRRIADLPPKDPLNAQFWMFHGIYSGSEILKVVLGAGIALRMCLVRKKHGQDAMAARHG
jgi:hypothetical protein